MEMSIALQIALFLASLAIVVLVVCIVPIAFQVGHSMKHLARTTERLEASTQALLHDSRELVRNITDLSDRTSRYMEEAGKVSHIVHLWAERADQFSKVVGSLVEPSILSLLFDSKALRVGATVFLKTLLRPHKQEQSEKRHNPIGEE